MKGILPKQRWLVTFERSLFAVTPTRRTEYISTHPVEYLDQQKKACPELNVVLLFAMEVPFES